MGEMDMAAFPDEVLEYVLKFLTSRKDRNAVSLVCKAWCRTESFSRQAVYIGNCYAVSPEILIRRFPRVKCVTLKGKPRFADFGLVPYQWGAFLYPWVAAMALEYPWLEELRLKRMTVTDESLAMLAHSFPNFRLLVLINCDGFSTDGLAAVASRCRHLRELNLQECEVENHGGHWLSCFPETFTSLVSLNFACLEGAVNYDALERLVARSPSLQSLRLNKEVTLQQLQRLLVRAPQLVDLGTGSYCQQLKWGQYAELQAALTNCKSLASLSGFWDVAPVLIRSLYSICPNLTSLNLSYVTLSSSYFCKLISCCSKLQKLWVQDSVEDKGLQQVGMVCRDLRELRVFPQHPARQGNVTEAGLEFISRGCPNLSSVLYFCRQCTNESVAVVARNCPGLIRFRLCIITPFQTDHITGEPMDEAFGAIVKHCKNLRRLAVSGLLTDKAFEYIGMYGKKLETLSVAFAGESDVGMQHVLNGCTNLRKLEIRDSPFGDTALLSGMERYESMRFLWMSSCKVTLLGCGSLAVQKTRLNVEIIKPEDGIRFVLGTGLKECILSGLLSNLQMDRNEYYGGDSASLTLTQIWKKFRENENPPLGSKRDYNIGMVLKFMMANGALVRVLIHTDVTKYLSFKAVDGSYVYVKGKIYKVPGPANDMEALKSPLMGLFEKRRARKFFIYVQEYDEKDPKTHDGLDLTVVPFRQVVQKFGLEENTIDFIGHALALHRDDMYLDQPALGTVKRVKSFARLSAVYGGTYMLAKPECKVEFDEEGKVRGITSAGETVAAKKVVCDPSYLPDKVRKVGKVARAICIMSHLIPETGDTSSVQIILQQKQLGRHKDMYLFCCSFSHNVAPKGKFIAFVSTEAETDRPEEELEPWLRLLGVVDEIFFEVYDRYEPANDFSTDNCFISKSYDATTHFDVLAMYTRITGKVLNLSVDLSAASAVSE